MRADVYRIRPAGISLLLGLFLCAAAAAEVTTLDLPDIGDSTGGLLSPEFERRLGQAFLSQVRKQADIVSDPEVNTYIESIGYRLVSQSDNNEQQFTFFVINDTLINCICRARRHCRDQRRRDTEFRHRKRTRRCRGP